jgi:RNA polymerase sigma-70 factor, ECF subfamily
MSGALDDIFQNVVLSFSKDAGMPADSSLEGRIATLFVELRKPLHLYLTQLLGDYQIAEEITQDAFLSLHACLKGGEKVVNVHAWLFKVGHNLALNHHRRASTSMEVWIGEISWEKLRSSRSGGGLTPEQQSVASERRAQVAQALGKLSSQQRNCICLRMRGFRYREIAEILSVSESTVNENLKRALVRLVKELHVP